MARLTPRLALSCIAAATMLLAGAPALAEENPEEAATETLPSPPRVTTQLAAPPPLSVEQPTGSVVLAQPGDELGSIRYGRSEAGDSFSVTRFSRFNDAAGRGMVGGPMPSVLPIAGARLTSRYGFRIHPITGRRAHHGGIDLAAPMGTRVPTTMDGVVSYAGWLGGYGLVVKIQHGNGIETLYAHLSRIAVSTNQQVSQGDVIGMVGATGRTTGPHLHYEVRRFGRSVDPLR